MKNVLYCLFACLLIFSAWFIKKKVNPIMTEIIETNTQLTHKTLRIGVGNVSLVETTDSNGANKKSITSVLWFYVKNKPDLNRSLRVKIGDIVDIATFRVKVRGITAKSTELEIVDLN